MTREQLYATFMLDQSEDLEIALPAEQVAEATPIQGRIMPLPGAISFIEGIMHLREQTIPVINLKKRLGLARTDYGDDARVAVVTVHDQRFGLLVDDIRDVFRADGGAVVPLNPALQTEDRLVSSLLYLERGSRTAELLDLKKLFLRSIEEFEVTTEAATIEQRSRGGKRSRFVIFVSGGQEYGVPVKYAQEITFLAEIDEMFKSGMLAGALNLRGRTVPVMHGRQLLQAESSVAEGQETENRVLVLSNSECSFGMIVEEVREILSIPEEDILPLPVGQASHLTGIYGRSGGNSVLLLDMPELVCNQLDDIKSMSRLGNGKTKGEGGKMGQQPATHHLITENCYLVFSIGKHFAIELKDVLEIIENDTVLALPGGSGHSRTVINLRGQVVPVVNLHSFYNGKAGSRGSRLIICRGDQQTVALEVDQVVTIYKQEHYHHTPSLNPRLADKRDTLDRLIEFAGPDGVIEHVLVVNTYNLVRNHLQYGKAAEERRQRQQQPA